MSFPSRSKFEAALGGAFTGLAELAHQGAQGVVYSAIAADGSKVALKLYDRAQVEERSLREVEALRKISCPSLTRLQSAGDLRVEGTSFRFIATSFIEGEVLAERLRPNRATVAEVARVGVDTAVAVEALWGAKIVHRDIKPGNIMITSAGRAVLIDLGVARHLDQSTLTATGFTLGTQGYMAPEHALGRPLTCKADIFSLGIVMLECLLGRHPTFHSQQALMVGIPSVPTINPPIPRSMNELLSRMLRKDAHSRPLPRAVALELAPLL